MTRGVEAAPVVDDGDAQRLAGQRDAQLELVLVAGSRVEDGVRHELAEAQRSLEWRLNGWQAAPDEWEEVVAKQTVGVSLAEQQAG